MGRITYLTSESVTEGHPDKICDQIADTILDAILAQDSNARVAIECLTTTGTVHVAGEVTTSAYADIQKIARNVLKDIGYTDPRYGIDCDDAGVWVAIHSQSPDISKGVTESENKEQGAGDQGMMYGYACSETPELMPLPIILANRLTAKMAEVRRLKLIPHLGPDGKAQISIKYEDGKPICASAVVVAQQHTKEISEEELRKLIIEHIITPVCSEYITSETKIHVNATGAFVIGGPEGDTGVTGRKIIVDTYGGVGRHGGGAFSGKDPSKVDRSGAYAARYIAKNIVAAGLAEKCEVQLSYCIGVARPTSVNVDCFGTNKISEDRINKMVIDNCPLTPKWIIEKLNLKRPIYRATSVYGHFGRENFPWEKKDLVDIFKKYLE